MSASLPPADPSPGADPPEAPPPRPPARGAGRGGGAAALVAVGILLSRLSGLVRAKVLAYFLGLGDEKDALGAALRIPNLLQNLLGEGALSASFIPVYAGLRAAGDDEEADRVAGAVLALLALVTSVVVLLGVLLAPQVVTLLADDYAGAKRALTVHLVRIAFPGVGLLVLGAWCLGILNSHRRFLLPYAVPVLSNAAIVGALLYGWYVGGARGDRLAWYAELAAWGFVAGALLQVLVQLPTVRRLAGGVRPTLRTDGPVRTVLRNFAPAAVSRGAAQIGSYVDLTIATRLGTGALSALTDAQLLYTLPVSLFGMSVSAAELPAMSSVRGSEAEIADALRARLEAAARRIAYFVVPSAAAFLLLGDMVASVVLVGGEFTYADAVYVWAILAGSTIGLLAATLARLVSSSFYALRDTRTPLRFAVVRIALGIALGVALALWLPGALGIDERWGAAFLTASSGVAGWAELLLLRRAIERRVGRVRLAGELLPRLWLAALAAGAVGWGVKLLVGLGVPQLTGVLALAAFGVAYLAITAAAGMGEAGALAGALRRRLRR